MTAEELMRRYRMRPHEENGSFSEQHYAQSGTDRPASGLIYYYVAPDEITSFHRIDCDEYWCYTAGAPLEVWQIGEDGTLTVGRLGTGEGCDPVLLLRRGTLFGSRHAMGETEGTFLGCITVPRFSYDGFEMIPEEEMLRRYPALKPFYQKQ